MMTPLVVDNSSLFSGLTTSSRYDIVPYMVKRPNNLTVEELQAYLYSRVTKTRKCWLWTGASDKYGYGRIQGPDKKLWLTHRLAWWFEHRDLTDGIDVLHRCDNPPCLRLDHLFSGIHQDNMDDMWDKGRAYTKLSVETVSIVRDLYRTTEASQRDLARRFGVTQAQIWNIVNNRQRTDR